MTYLVLYYLTGLAFQFWAMKRCGLTLSKLADEIGVSHLPCGVSLVCAAAAVAALFWPLGILMKPPAGVK